MTTLLHIQCSPRKHRSASLEVARSFIARYQANTPDTEIITLDLWNMALPEFDDLAMEAKYAGLNGTPLTTAQQEAWNTLEALASHLHRADVLVMSVPLWNFSIPYKLKHFIDLVSQKDILFSVDPQRGLEGMLHNKLAVVMYAPRPGFFGAVDHTGGALRLPETLRGSLAEIYRHHGCAFGDCGENHPGRRRRSART